MPDVSVMRKQCWDYAVDDFGTGYIFERRARRYRNLLRLLTFLGIIVPVFVGGIVMTYGVKAKYIGLILTGGGILSLIQLVASVWALVAKWDDQYAYAQESTSANYDLSTRYKAMAENPPDNTDQFQTRLEFLNAENQRRNDADYRQGITDKEKRMGMRSALRNFRRKCPSCDQEPKSMKPSSCDTCGNF